MLFAQHGEGVASLQMKKVWLLSLAVSVKEVWPLCLSANMKKACPNEDGVACASVPVI